VASKISTRICAVISTVNRVCLMDGPLLPSKVSSRCPAIMFAVSRTAKVSGRMRLLIVSIITINGINIVGVPCGTKCSNMWFVFLIHLNSINLSHIGRTRVSVRVRCLVLVKMYGNNPKKLFVRIIRNRDVRMNEFPLFSFPFLKIVFISWCNLFINKFTIMLFRDGTSQILVGINRSPMAVLVQFNGKLLISVVGSKIENKFLITFSLFYEY
jgi:hypothetical protein